MNFKTLEEKQKELNILTQSKGQLEASITKVEKHLSSEDFKDYCDALYTCVGYIQLIQKQIRDQVIFPVAPSNYDDTEDLPFT